MDLAKIRLPDHLLVGRRQEVEVKEVVKVEEVQSAVEEELLVYEEKRREDAVKRQQERRRRWEKEAEKRAEEAREQMEEERRGREEEYVREQEDYLGSASLPSFPESFQLPRSMNSVCPSSLSLPFLFLSGCQNLFVCQGIIYFLKMCLGSA